MSLDPLNLWLNVTEKIGFYPPGSCQNIPDAPGIYAWYLPLWIYFDDMEEFVSFVQSVSFYPGEDNEGELIKNRSRIDFRWDGVEVDVKKTPKTPNYENWGVKWDAMMGDSESKASFEEALMKASIFNPPLYIGRADNLASRYQQHVEGVYEKNTFNKRFTSHMERLNRNLLVSDLLFVCVPISVKDNMLFNDRQLTELLEKIMLHTGRPPYSER